ncbi:MAG: ATP-binding protein [Phycisphaerales bacterium]
MSLQRKFVILLGLLGLTVMGSLAATIWTFAIQRRALSGPFEDAPGFLDDIATAKQHLTRADAALRADEAPDVFLGLVSDESREQWQASGTDSARRRAVAKHEFETSMLGVNQAIGRMSDSDLYLSSGPESAIQAIATPAQRAIEAARGWFEQSDPVRRTDAQAQIDRARDVSEQVRIRILDDLGRGIGLSNDIVSNLVTVLISAAVASLLLGVQALVLLRRWVQQPVQHLREAAARIAKGDFDHQIPVHGQDEIAQLSSEVNHMASTIKTMMDERVERERLAALGEMVRRLAHSLRNPLSGIRGLAELTREELPADSELREHQGRILKAVDRFEKWLSDLLSTTRPLQMDFSAVDARAFISNVIDAHRALAQTTGVVIEVQTADSPNRAWCDAAHLEHAVVSVVTNAIQASPVGGRVTLVSRVAGEEWEIAVADEGPGIPPELREKAFSPYFTTKKNGTGIGLAVALQVVRAHGGTMEISSNSDPNRKQPGCRVLIRLPLRAGGTPKDLDSSRTPNQGAITSRAQDTDHRGQRGPAVLHQANPGQVRTVRI